MNKKKANVSVNQEIETDFDEQQGIETPPLTIGNLNRGGDGGRQRRINPTISMNWETTFLQQDIGTVTNAPVATEDAITEARFQETVDIIDRMRNQNRRNMHEANFAAEHSTLLTNMLARMDNNTGRTE